MPDIWSKEDQLKFEWKDAKDQHSGLKKISYAIDGGAYVDVAVINQNGEVELDIADLEDGEHKLSLVFADQVGNQLKKEYPFYRDTEAPLLDITAPLAGDLVNGNLEIWGNVNDLSLLEWTVTAIGQTSGKEAVLSGDKEYNQELLGVLDLREFHDGENITLTLQAKDAAGNENEVSGIVIKVDKSAKQIDGEVAIKNPLKGEVIRIPRQIGKYQKEFEESETAGYYYIDGVFAGNTTEDSFNFDAIQYEENSLHSISVISQGENGGLYYSEGLAAYMIMSETFADQNQTEIITEELSSPKEILALRLHATEALSTDAVIEYFYSVDGKETWIPIKNDQDEPLKTGTKSVFLKAVLQSNGTELPKLHGWQLEAVIEMSPTRVVSRLMNETKSLQLDIPEKIERTPAAFSVSPSFGEADKKWLFTDGVMHENRWSYNALSVPERTSHNVSALAEAEGVLYGSGVVKNELLIRENPTERIEYRKIENSQGLYGIRLLALTEGGQGKFQYSTDGSKWEIAEPGQNIIFNQVLTAVYIKPELPEDTVLTSWHLEGFRASGKNTYVELVKKPIQLTATDYKNIYHTNKERKYELNWQDPDSKNKDGSYTTKYRIYRNGAYLTSTEKLTYTDKDYKTGASYEVETLREYKHPGGSHLNYLTRASEKTAAHKIVLEAEKKVDAVNHKVEEVKQSEGLDKLYGGNYTFSDNKRAPKDDAELKESLLGKSNYCVAGFEPINFNTGNFFMEAGDYERSDYGSHSLEIMRTYNTQSSAEDGPLGAKWEFEYGQHLIFYEDAIGYRKADGILYIYRKDKSGTYASEEAQEFHLKENIGASGYIVTQTDGTEYHFTAGGLLKDIIRGGDTTRIKRNKKGVITEVIAPSKERLQIESDEKGHIIKITTPEKKELKYEYQGKNLTAYTDAEGVTVKYVYDSQGRMTEWYDGSNVRQVLNRYDDKDRVTYQEDARAGKYTLEYHNDHTITTDAEGGKYEVYFDEKKRTIKEIDAEGNEILHTYTEDGYLGGKTDQAGRLTSYEYDGNGNCIKETQPDGSEILMTYDVKNRQTSVTDQNGNTTQYKYDDKDNRIEEIHPDGSSSRYQYDNDSQLVKEINELGYETIYQYKNGQQILKRDPMGNQTAYEYGADGNVKTETDALGNKKQYQYDGAGNLTKVIFSDGSSETYTYDSLNRETSHRDANGNITKYEYDGLGNKIAEITPDGSTIKTAYSLNNDPVSIINENGDAVSYKYDGNGNKIEEQDEQGNITKYEYDSSGNLTKEILPSGAEVTYEYDAATGKLLRSKDETGRVMTYEFNKAGLPVKQSVSGVGSITFTYDKRNRLVKKVGETGGVTTYTYNKAGWCTEEVNPLGAKTSYEHDKNGNIIKTTDALGYEEKREYDGLGRVVKIQNQLGAITTFTYDAFGNVITQKDTNGNTTAFEYDTNGNMVKLTDPLGHAIEYSYDSRNNQTLITHKNGGEYSKQYDSTGRLIKETDVLGNEVNYVYNKVGLVTKVTDAKGYSAVYDYDSLGKVTMIELDGEGKTTYERDSAGNVISMTDELGAKTEYIYDSKGFLREEKSGETAFKYKYNKAGQVSVITASSGGKLKYKYDKAGQLCATVYPDGSEEANEYDALGNVVKEKNALGEELLFSYDEQSYLTSLEIAGGVRQTWKRDVAGRAIAETDGEGNTRHFTYDEFGNMAEVQDGLGNKTQCEYGIHDKITKVTDALGHTTEYEYDAKGNLLKEKDAEGNISSYEYTAEGYLAKVVNPDGTHVVYTYDASGNLIEEEYPGKEKIQNTYNEAGRLITAQGSEGKTSYQYDHEGNILSVTTPDKETITYSYDEYGRKSGLTYPDGKTVSYSYDKMDRLTKVTGLDGKEVVYEYDKAGRKTSVKDEKLETVYEYDSLGNMIRQKSEGTSDLELRYSYNKNNMLTGEIRISKGKEVKSDYAYDNNNQLIEFQRSDGYQESFQYDSVGNMTVRSIGKEKIEMTYNSLNQLIEMGNSDGNIRYTYDSKGNLIEKQLGDKKDQYTYDGTNQLVEFRGYDGYVKEYTYDTQGMLIKTKEQGEEKRETLEEILRDVKNELSGEDPQQSEGEWIETRYVHDVTSEYHQVLTESRKGSNISYEYGLDRIGAYSEKDGLTEKTNYLLDNRGSVRQIVAADGVDELAYTPYGEILEGNDISGYGYTGEAYDAATGFVNLRARHYEPSMARFNQKDMVRGVAEDPVTMNPYPYVKNDPVNYTDPSGMAPKWLYDAARVSELGMKYLADEARKAGDTEKAKQYDKAANAWNSTAREFAPSSSEASQTAAQAVRQALSRKRVEDVGNVLGKKAQGADGKVPPEYQKIVDEANKKAEDLHKQGKLTDAERDRIINEACKKIDKAQKEKEGEAKKTKSHISKEYLLTLPAGLTWAQIAAAAKAALAGAGVTAGTVWVVAGGVIIPVVIYYGVATRDYRTVPTTAREAIAAGAGSYIDPDTGKEVFVSALAAAAGLTYYDKDVEEKIAEAAERSSSSKSKEKIPVKSKEKLPENVQDAYDRYEKSGWKGSTKDQTSGTKIETVSYPKQMQMVKKLPIKNMM